MDFDWQNRLYEIKSRGQHLLKTEKWADCRFLVGTPPNHRIISAHKLILAMASPVFERMFFGNLPPDKDPIEIPDVQPDAFMGMLEYVYTDRVVINSFDKACELCYVAKKYMLPFVVESCTAFLWDDLSPKNACRAYEFAKLFDEPRLMHSSMEIIAKNTKAVLQEPNFTDIEPSTLISILDQDKLNVDSELDLFNAILRYSKERVYCNEEASNSNQQQQQQQQQGGDQIIGNDSIDVVAVRPEEIKMEPDVAAMVQGHDDSDEDEDIDPTAYVASPAHCNEDVLVIDSDASAADVDEVLELNRSNSEVASASSVSINNLIEMQRLTVDESIIRLAIKKIRFLTMTPQQFAEGPARSQLLKQDEALAILIKISSPSINDCPMPAGFCSSRNHRRDPTLAAVPVPSAADRSCSMFEPGFPLNAADPDLFNTNDARRSYCIRTIDQQYDFRNTSVTDCGLTFQVDTNIWIMGVQVPTQVLCGELMNEAAGFPERYTEILYAHLQDIQGSRLTYTHCTSRVRYDSYLEISFDRPIYINRNQIYKIYVVFNKIGWYPMYTCVPDVICNRVKFMFNVGNPSESVRDGLIRAIVFTVAAENSRPMIE